MKAALRAHHQIALHILMEHDLSTIGTFIPKTLWEVSLLLGRSNFWGFEPIKP